MKSYHKFYNDLFEGRQSNVEVRCFVRLDDGLVEGNYGPKVEESYGTIISGWETFFQNAAHSVQSQQREQQLSVVSKKSKKDLVTDEKNEIKNLKNMLLRRYIKCF